MNADQEKRQKFVGLIAFRPSTSKVAACLSFLRSVMEQTPELSGIDMGSIMLLAEASHLSAYGRPVTGCRYHPIADGWRPEMPTGVMTAGEVPAQGSNRIGIEDVAVPDDLEITFPDLSKSDMDHMLQAALALHANPMAAARRFSDMLHNGRPDYALMLEEADTDILERKLADLAGWSRYIYLGREN